MLSRHVTDSLALIRTPFYLYDMELLDATLRSAMREAGRYGYRVHYAVKANFDPRILDRVRLAGLGADCVSGNEVRAAAEAGFDPRSIVYAGVGKSDAEIEYALATGIGCFNCESSQELEVIDRIAGRMGRRADVALRINPDVDPMTHRHISTGHADSKFGISYLEIEQVADRLHTMKNLNVIGLHFHIGSQITQMRVFEYLCHRVNSLVEWFTARGFRLSMVNLGGGLGIDYLRPEDEPVPGFETYFALFDHNLALGEGMEVHFELGRSLVGQCGELIARVLYNKTNAAGRQVAVIDASMSELIRPALYGAHHAIENLSNRNPGDQGVFTVVGTACESSDVFLREVTVNTLRRGDLVTLKSAGAYGASMASRYNLHALPAAVYSDDL